MRYRRIATVLCLVLSALDSLHSWQLVPLQSSHKRVGGARRMGSTTTCRRGSRHCAFRSSLANSPLQFAHRHTRPRSAMTTTTATELHLLLPLFDTTAVDPMTTVTTTFTTIGGLAIVGAAAATAVTGTLWWNKAIDEQAVHKRSNSSNNTTLKHDDEHTGNEYSRTESKSTAAEMQAVTTRLLSDPFAVTDNDLESAVVVVNDIEQDKVSKGKQNEVMVEAVEDESFTDNVPLLANYEAVSLLNGSNDDIPFLATQQQDGPPFELVTEKEMQLPLTANNHDETIMMPTPLDEVNASMTSTISSSKRQNSDNRPSFLSYLDDGDEGSDLSQETADQETIMRTPVQEAIGSMTSTISSSRGQEVDNRPSFLSYLDDDEESQVSATDVQTASLEEQRPAAVDQGPSGAEHGDIKQNVAEPSLDIAHLDHPQSMTVHDDERAEKQASEASAVIMDDGSSKETAVLLAAALAEKNDLVEPTNEEAVASMPTETEQARTPLPIALDDGFISNKSDKHMIAPNAQLPNASTTTQKDVPFSSLTTDDSIPAHDEPSVTSRTTEATRTFEVVKRADALEPMMSMTQINAPGSFENHTRSSEEVSTPSAGSQEEEITAVLRRVEESEPSRQYTPQDIMKNIAMSGRSELGVGTRTRNTNGLRRSSSSSSSAPPPSTSSSSFESLKTSLSILTGVSPQTEEEEYVDDETATDSLRRYIQDQARDMTRRRMGRTSSGRTARSDRMAAAVTQVFQPPVVDKPRVVKAVPSDQLKIDAPAVASADSDTLPVYYAPVVDDPYETRRIDAMESTEQVSTTDLDEQVAKSLKKKSNVSKRAKRSALLVTIASGAIVVGKRLVSIAIGRGML